MHRFESCRWHGYYVVGNPIFTEFSTAVLKVVLIDILHFRSDMKISSVGRSVMLGTIHHCWWIKWQKVPYFSMLSFFNKSPIFFNLLSKKMQIIRHIRWTYDFQDCLNQTWVFFESRPRYSRISLEFWVPRPSTLLDILDDHGFFLKFLL